MSRKYRALFNSLKDLASKLPELPKYKTLDSGEKVIHTKKKHRILTGAKWLELDKLATLPDGTAPKPFAKYRIDFAPEPVLVDHFKELKATFFAEGEDGVNKYIDVCYNFNQKERPGDLIFTTPEEYATRV